MKPHLALAAITLSAINFSSYAEEVWFALSYHAGACVPLSAVWTPHSDLNGARTPSELFDRMKARAPDTKIQPLIETRRVGEKPKKPDPEGFELLLQNFSESNAYVVSSKSLGFGLEIFEMSLCQKLNIPIIRDLGPGFRTR